MSGLWEAGRIHSAEDYCMKTENNYSPNTRQKVNPYIEVCHNVILSAYKDLVRDKEPFWQRRAHRFFEGGMYEYWAILAGIDPEVAYKGYLNVLENGLPERGDNG